VGGASISFSPNGMRQLVLFAFSGFGGDCLCTVGVFCGK
jgi:hypothetical protein